MIRQQQSLPLSAYSGLYDIVVPMRNLVKELESITASSGAMSRKYLNDISYLERSTISKTVIGDTAYSEKENIELMDEK